MFYKNSLVRAVENYGNGVLYKGAIGRIEDFSFQNGERMFKVDVENNPGTVLAPERCWELYN